jgi:transposase
MLEVLGEVYGYDAQAEEQRLSPEERLRFHQEHSEPVMKQLHAWLRAQFDEKRVEPNSGLGEAIGYLLKHWDRLTLFLRQPGAPLDNNICERALKKAIRHRKNSLFYKTENGAGVGDLFMSLIHTCELNGANPFDYLTGCRNTALSWRNILRPGCRGITARPWPSPVPEQILRSLTLPEVQCLSLA